MRGRLVVVCFDWGNTLMRIYPGQEGPMARWPKVAAMPGADTALRTLSGSYRLAVLTTGGGSSAVEVRQALRRVGLERYFESIILPGDLGLSKSDPEFYRAALSRLGHRPDRAVMIGDSYENDIAAAKEAGLRTVWYVPFGTTQMTSPRDSKADAVISDLAELPAVLARLASRLGQDH